MVFFKKFKHILLAVFLVLIAYLTFKYIYPQPRNWYDHYLYQARAFLEGRTNVVGMPDYYQDKVTYQGKDYVPFPPAPAATLSLFLKVSPSITQQEISILVGAITVGLIFILLLRFTTTIKAFLISMFFGFGTVFFWASVVGTTWYFAHVVAIFFLTTSLIFYYAKKDLLAGIFFTLAVCSRIPIFAGSIFFFLELFKDKKRLFTFFSTGFLWAPILLGYDFVRFGNLFETGYVKVYETYIHSLYPYTILQLMNPNFPYFGYMDIRNIPLHLITFLGLPPIISKAFEIIPSPYGMGIIFTSPLLLLSLKPKLKDVTQRNLFIGALAIGFIDFLHYMQGWVQFGYRFALDFIVFLLIILAIKFDIKKNTIILLIISIIVSTWGVIQGIKLGW